MILRKGTSVYSFPLAGQIENDWRRWGLLEVFIGLVFGHLLAAFAYAFANGVGGYEDFADYPLWLVAVANFPLQGSMLLAAIFAALPRGRSGKRLPASGETKRHFSGNFGRGRCTIFSCSVLTYPVLWLFDKDIEDVRKIAEELTDRPSTSPVGVIALIAFVGLFTPNRRRVILSRTSLWFAYVKIELKPQILRLGFCGYCISDFFNRPLSMDPLTCIIWGRPCL